MGSIDGENLENVIKSKAKKYSNVCHGDYTNRDFIKAIKWLESQSGKNCVGDILINMGAVENRDLIKAIENQLLSESQIKEISEKDWPKLLLTSLLLGQIRHLPHVFSQSLEVVSELIGCECGSILLADNNRNSLIFTVVTGPHKNELKNLAIPIDKGIAGWVFCNGKHAIINEVSYDERFNDFVDKSLGFQTRSILAVPLVYGDRIIGVVEVVNKNDGIFNKRDVAILSIYSHQFVYTIDSILWTIDKIKEQHEYKK